MRKDLHNNIKVLTAIAPVVATDNTALVSSIIDRQGFNALEFAALLGTLADADATFAVTMRHGDVSNLSDGAAVPSNQMLGALTDAGFTFADDGGSRKVGYIGIKRYVELTITPTGNSGNAPIAVAALLGAPSFAPPT